MPWSKQRRLSFWLCLLLIWTHTGAIAASEHAVVLVYHHVANDTPASTSVSPELFAAHLAYLAQADFTVLSLGSIVKLLKQQQPLPPRTVALTFDDAYRSVLTTALPMLAARNWPFTVFVNTAATDRGAAPYMNWSQLEELVAAGVEIGNHSHTHAHLVAQQPDESKQQWQLRVNQDITAAHTRLQEKLGVETELFAYPYGEFTPELTALVAALDLTGVAQHSGAIDQFSDFLALPRFAMAGRYAELDNFVQRVNARPLHLQANPRNGYVVPAPDTLPQLELQLMRDQPNPTQLNCFAGGHGRMGLEQTATNQWQLRFDKPLNVGRTRINCTLPDSDRSGQFLWWSYLLMQPTADGKWYTW
ncbi:MAG: polysaccharide deacetylase family protein [Pseudomonadota bacterium]